MTEQEVEQLKAVIQRTVESFRRVIQPMIEMLRRSVRWFVKWFKTHWARCITRHGTDDQKKRAAIYLRTKSRRIRRKQWRHISP